MVEEYYETRVDRFLASSKIRPEESKWDGYTQEDRKRKRQELLEAGLKKGKFPERKQK